MSVHDSSMVCTFRDLRVCHRLLWENRIHLDAWMTVTSSADAVSDSVVVGSLSATLTQPKYLLSPWKDDLAELEHCIGRTVRPFVIKDAFVEGFARSRGIGTMLYLAAHHRAYNLRGVLLPGKASPYRTTSDMAGMVWDTLKRSVGSFGCLLWGNPNDRDRETEATVRR